MPIALPHGVRFQHLVGALYVMKDVEGEARDSMHAGVDDGLAAVGPVV